MCSNKVLWIIIICFFAAFIANLSVSTCWMCHLEKNTLLFWVLQPDIFFFNKKTANFLWKTKIFIFPFISNKAKLFGFLSKETGKLSCPSSSPNKANLFQIHPQKRMFFVVFWTDSLCFIRESWINNEILNVSIVYQNKTSSLQTNFHSSININELKKDLLKEKLLDCTKKQTIRRVFV